MALDDQFEERKTSIGTCKKYSIPKFIIMDQNEFRSLNSRIDTDIMQR